MVLGSVAATACSSEASGDDALPDVVVTTSILGDITSELLGEDTANVEVLMPRGADPHEFSVSARQAEAMQTADLLVVNGAGLETGLEALIEQVEADGVEVFAFADHVELLELGEAGAQHEHEHEREHEAEHEGEHEGEHGEDDPHIWTDPARMAEGAMALSEAAGALDGVDPEGIEESASAYADELRSLDSEIESLVAGVPEDQRVLVTNHEAFGYFADRYGFEVVGTVIPSLSTLAEASAADLEDLAGVIEDHDVPAIFAETTQSTELADNLAEQVGEVEVVELYSGSLGEDGSGAESYVDMMRTDATRVVDALS